MPTPYVEKRLQVAEARVAELEDECQAAQIGESAQKKRAEQAEAKYTSAIVLINHWQEKAEQAEAELAALDRMLDDALSWVATDRGYGPDAIPEWKEHLRAKHSPVPPYADGRAEEGGE